MGPASCAALTKSLALSGPSGFPPMKCKVLSRAVPTCPLLCSPHGDPLGNLGIDCLATKIKVLAEWNRKGEGQASTAGRSHVSEDPLGPQILPHLISPCPSPHQEKHPGSSNTIRTFYEKLPSTQTGRQIPSDEIGRLCRRCAWIPIPASPFTGHVLWANA